MATIVIAESGDTLGALVGPELRRKGHAVILASMEKALEGYKPPPDLILMEVPADPALGIERVRQMARGNASCVIAVTPEEAADPSAARTALLNAGAADCLSAPAHPAEVVARIEIRLSLAESARKLLSYSALDTETGAYSSWLFEKRLAEEHTKASRYPMPLSLLLVAPDDFDALRSRCGAPFAGTVLRELALIIQHSLRTSDFVARNGPAEFAILLPFTSPTDALVCAERIRGRTEIFPFRHETSSANATVSVGVAGHSAKRTPDPQVLLREARICLDFALKHGGNQVVVDERYMPESAHGAVPLEALLEHLRSGEELLQVRAYHALREAGTRATPVLLRGVQDPLAHVRRYCAWILGMVGEKTAAPSIAPLLKDPDPDVRAVTAWALGRIGDATVVPTLIEAIADEDAQVRDAAALSISMLSAGSLRPNAAGTLEEVGAEADRCQKEWAKRGKEA